MAKDQSTSFVQALAYSKTTSVACMTVLVLPWFVLICSISGQFDLPQHLQTDPDCLGAPPVHGHRARSAPAPWGPDADLYRRSREFRRSRNSPSPPVSAGEAERFEPFVLS